MTEPSPTPPLAHADSPSRLSRGFSFRSALALAFADVSPIAAVYAIFTLGLFAAGPKFFWAFPIVLVGQLLVAGVFGELASRWPYAGSVYQWSRHVRGTTWGWAAAWAYMWGLTHRARHAVVRRQRLPAADLRRRRAVAVGDGRGRDRHHRPRHRREHRGPAGAEDHGRSPASRARSSARSGLGIVLLVFYRENPFSALFSSAGIPDAATWTSGPMLLAIAFVGLVVPRVRGGGIGGRGGRRPGAQRAQGDHLRSAAGRPGGDVLQLPH